MANDAVNVVGGEGEIVSVKPVRLGLVGCGAHAYRNTLPPLRQIPAAVLTSFCDLNVEKARLYAKTLGTDAGWYGSVDEMLAGEPLDAVLMVVGFDDEDGHPLYPDVADPILRAGIPVWMEKPPAADRHGVARMMEAAEAGGTFAQVGFKKVFSPAVDRLKRITQLPEFGPIAQYHYSYDVDVPAQLGNLRSPSARRFLDDFVHVASVLEYVVGSPSTVQVVRGPTGAGMIVCQHANGAVGVIVLSNATSGLAPVERLEVVGDGANAVLENGAYLRYYPRGTRGPYGTSTSYLPPLTETEGPDFGPRAWEPEFSLGNLHGGSHFIQGYYHQMKHFVECVQRGERPQRCDLGAAWRVMTWIDTLAGSFDEWRQVEGQAPVRFEHTVDAPDTIVCPATGKPLVLKDGWNYVCRDCGRTRSGRDRSEFVCHAVSAA